MKKNRFIHYTSCFFALARRYLLLGVNWVKNNILKIVAISKCIYLSKIQRENENLKSGVLELFHQDQGKLCEDSDFLYAYTKYDLSIIIPLYNVSKFVETCIKSIVNQETKYSYEIILVDDGSIDNTCEVVDSFLNNENILLIKQKNQGQSVARNKAIYQSQGRYIMFVDSDDILLPDSIESLLNKAFETESEIVEGEFVSFYQVSGIEKNETDKKIKTKIKKYANTPRFVLTTYGYSWAKVYKREVWKTLRFPEGYIFEDVITKFVLRRNANQVAFIDLPVYGYRQNASSSSHGSNQMKKLDSIWVFPKIVELCKRENAPLDDIFYYLALNHVGILNYIILRNQSLEIKKAGFAEIQKQLSTIQEYRPKKMPLMFALLEKTILAGRENDWEYVARTIVDFNLLKKWREIN